MEARSIPMSNGCIERLWVFEPHLGQFCSSEGKDLTIQACFGPAFKKV